MVKKKQPKRKLTIKQQRFIEEVIKSWNKSEAAAKVYKTKNMVVAWSIGYENFKKPQIKAEIEERLKDAKNMIYSIAMTWAKEDVRVRACQDIIDRIEWKASQKIITEWSVDVNIDYKNLSVDELIKLARTWKV